MTLSKKFLLVIAAVVLAVGGMGIASFRQTYAELDGQLNDAGLNFIRRAASEIDLFLGNYETMASEIAAVFGMLASDPSDFPKLEEGLERLWQANRHRGVLNVFIVMADTGRLIDGRHTERADTEDMRATPWYASAIAREGSSVSSPYYDSTTDQVVFSAFDRLYAENGGDARLVGLIGIVVRMDDIRELLRSQRLGAHDDGFHVFVHKNGDLLSTLPKRAEQMWDIRSERESYHLPQNITRASGYVPEELASAGRDMVRGASGFRDLSMNGASWRLFYAPTRADLVIGYMYPMRLLYAQESRIIAFTLLLTLTTMALILFVFIPVSRDLQRIVGSIGRTSLRIRELFQPKLRPSELSEDEIRLGQLETSFAVMQDEVREQMETVSLAEFRKILSGMDVTLTLLAGQEREMAAFARELISLNRQLAKRELVWSSLLEITQSISVTTDFQDVLDRTCDALRSMTGAYGTGVVFSTSGQLRILASSGYGDRRFETLDKILLLSRAVTTRSIQWIEDTGADPEYANLDPQVVSEVELPLIHHAQVLGILVISFDRICRYSEELRDLLMPMASSLGGYLATWKAHKEVRASYEYLIAKFQEVADIYHHETADHLDRVSRLSGMAAAWMGCSPREQEDIMVFSRVHDLGKIRVPLPLIMKDSRLDPEEWEIMKQHTTWGAELIGPAEWLRIARNICLTHHEKWDGSGYPGGLRGEAIPREGRIVGLADIYDALRSERSYKRPYSHEEAVSTILEGDGRTRPEHFDPVLLEFFRLNHAEIGRMFDESSGTRTEE